jgi:hypothetical protein
MNGRSAGRSPARGTLAALGAALLAGCMAAPPVDGPPAAAVVAAVVDTPAREYRGEMDLWLLPYDDSGACSVTVGLRNASGLRQGEAWLTLAWLGQDGSELHPPSNIRMDPLLAGRYNAKNETLPLRCAELGSVEVRRAEWTLFAGWDAAPQPVVPIQDVSGTRWRLAWSEEQQAWRGELTPAP